MDQESDLDEMCKLIRTWREPGAQLIQPKFVIPDTTNRENTGLCVEHVHYIAHRMKSEGFQPDKHDVPVVVRESTQVEGSLGQESLDKWSKATARQQHFPRPSAELASTCFTSLGNGHFFQALNLFRTCRWGMFEEHQVVYSIRSDRCLREAIAEGVPGIVLRRETPRNVRRRISEILNSSFGLKWRMDGDGEIVVLKDEVVEACEQNSFERFSKNLDSYELEALVKMELDLRKKRQIRARSRL